MIQVALRAAQTCRNLLCGNLDFTGNLEISHTKKRKEKSKKQMERWDILSCLLLDIYIFVQLLFNF